MAETAVGRSLVARWVLSGGVWLGVEEPAAGVEVEGGGSRRRERRACRGGRMSKVDGEGRVDGLEGEEGVVAEGMGDIVLVVYVEL